MSQEILKDSKRILDDYISCMKKEINPSESYIKITRGVLSRFDVNITTQEDILIFLNRLKKPESEDPLHKWIGTYNYYVVILKRFFKWFNNSYCMDGIKRLKRKEKSTYKPSDLWTQEDDLLFLKYCPSKKYRCYHAISRDSSCRPSELLRLRIKDVVFKLAGDKQYAEILVNGKTGSRHIPLIDSIPYLKDWLDEHPERNNPNAFLIRGKKFKTMSSDSLRATYLLRHKMYFTKLQESDIPSEDKKSISLLLKKPWNPYIRRHSALTDKSKILKEHILRQHAGWTPNSDMPQVYLHYFGNESSNSILESYGLKPRSEDLDKMTPRQCPNCNEPNKIDSKFCVKCRMVLSYDTYGETVEEKQQNSDALATLSDQIMELTEEVHRLKELQKAGGQV